MRERQGSTLQAFFFKDNGEIKRVLFCNSFLLQIDRGNFISDLRVLLIKIHHSLGTKPFYWVLANKQVKC